MYCLGSCQYQGQNCLINNICELVWSYLGKGGAAESVVVFDAGAFQIILAKTTG